MESSVSPVRLAKTQKHSGILIGTAGVYFVASQLAMRGFHAAVTFGNAPYVDLLVSLPDASASASIQVKTAHKALRMKGRGDKKYPYQYQWAMGQHSALHHRADLFFALVDLRGVTDKLPDVFIVPSEVVAKYFDWGYFKDPTKKRWWRYHPKHETTQSYKNNWGLLEEYLDSKTGNEANIPRATSC